GQQLRQLGTLSRAEAWRSSWRWTALEPINSPLSDTLHPLADSTLGDAKRLSNRLLAPALLLSCQARRRRPSRQSVGSSLRRINVLPYQIVWEVYQTLVPYVEVSTTSVMDLGVGNGVFV